MSTASTRRDFLKTASVATAAVAMNAASYARVPGANDRLSIAQIGCGNRGYGAHMPGVYAHVDTQNFEITAVCDPWRVRREMANDRVKEWFGRDARQYVSYRDVVALDDVDAVMIASCDHQHTTHMVAAAEARKDIYCEKPLAMDLPTMNRAYDAIKANDVVFQAGTQLRSMPSFTGCRELYKTGIFGSVGRIQQNRNGGEPYWYGHIRDCNEEDVDWQEFLMDLPDRPFDPVHYTAWYGYRETSDGPVPGLASHYIDLVHYITGATFPTSCVCMGGTYTWIDEHEFTCPDHVQALWEYPEGFIVTYSTNFGNGDGNTFKLFGEHGVMDMLDWSNPSYNGNGAINKRGPVIAEDQPVEHVERPDHFLDWLQCIRTRETPNASLDAGYQHAVAVNMAVRASDTGKRMIFDREKREIREG